MVAVVVVKTDGGAITLAEVGLVNPCRAALVPGAFQCACSDLSETLDPSRSDPLFAGQCLPVTDLT